MMILAEVSFLLLLHDPSGREVRVNPSQVISLKGPAPGEPNKGMLADGSRCVVNLADGKWIAVVESCHEVEELLAATHQEQ